MKPRVFREASQPPKGLDRDIWKSSPRAQKTTGAVPGKGFAFALTSSHVFLAGCRHDELAWESQLSTGGAGGAFTSNLVRQLNQSEDLSQITYPDLLRSLPPMQNQHPQCEGRHKIRHLFNGVVGAQTLPVIFKVSLVDGKYQVEAGEIHGVVSGTVFAIYDNTAIVGTDKELGLLTANSVRAFRCILTRPVGFNVPDIAKASISRWNASRDFKVCMLNFKDIFPRVIDGICWVETTDEAHLTISRMANGVDFEFVRRDSLMSKHRRRLAVHLAKTRDLSEMFKGISDFHHHLYRSHSGTRAAERLPEVNVILQSLSQTNRNRPLQEPIYGPDNVENIVFRPNEVHTISIPDDTCSEGLDNKIYGLTLQNNSEHKLFPYLFYFDPTDYNIQVNAGIECGGGVSDIPAGKDGLLPGVTVQGDFVFHHVGGSGAMAAE